MGPRAKLVPTHDKDMAAQFLAVLDPTARAFTFQFFSDAGDGYAEVIHGSLDEVWPKVEALNTPDRRIGVFVTINETDLQGRRRENIVRARALFVDADNADAVQRCLAAIPDTGAAPSMAVRTSDDHAHFYWCCADLGVEEFTALQAALIERLGTDPAIKDLPRVMRLPGTIHWKDPAQPHLVSLQANHGAAVWKPQDLVAKLGLVLKELGTAAYAAKLAGLFGFRSRAPAKSVRC